MTVYIDRGTYSRVYRVSDGVEKRIKYTHIDSALREIAFITACAHPNIIEIYGANWYHDYVAIKLPYYSENLYQCLMRGIEPRDVYRYSLDISRAVLFLHINGIVHCDIKPYNILVGNGRAVLCDFGISQPTAERMRGNVQTVTYRAPEVPGSGRVSFTPKIDVWSIGCTIYEMCSGTHFAENLPNAEDSTEIILRAFGFENLDSRRSRLQALRRLNIKAVKSIIRDKLQRDNPERFNRFNGDGLVSIIAICMVPDTQRRIGSDRLVNALETLTNRKNCAVPAVRGNFYQCPTVDIDSVSQNVSETVLKRTTGQVLQCAQSIYNRVKINEPEQLVKSVCIFIAACTYPVDYNPIYSYINTRWDKKLIPVCTEIMQQIGNRII